MALKTNILRKIRRFAKTEKQETRVVLLQYNDGPTMIDIRKYYKNKDEEFVPGKGIAVPVEHLEDLKRSLVAAQKWLNENS